MKDSFGSRFSQLRKSKGLTQEQVANQLGLSIQAVSKWENDISCPDIQLLLEIAEMFDTTVDELLGKQKEIETKLVAEEERKDTSKMLLKINVLSSEGDRVKVNLPLSIVKVALSSGMGMPQISDNKAFQNIDFDQILAMIEQGIIGKLVEVESADGDKVEIFVE